MEIQMSPLIIFGMGVSVFVFIAGVFFSIFYFYKKRIQQVKKQEIHWNDSKIPISLVASFFGLKFLPFPFVLGHNNLNPRLVFFEDHFEYKVLRLRRKNYSDLDRVEIWTAPATYDLVFYFKDSIFTFSCNLGDADHLREALRFLQEKKCPLSEKAKGFLTG